MPAPKREPAMTRMSIYISEINRRRLEAIPRGEKTELVNNALDTALGEIERRKNFGEFMEMVKAIKPVKMRKSSEDMIRELRETGTIEP